MPPAAAGSRQRSPTSSTHRARPGRPKGVEIRHRSVVNLLAGDARSDPGLPRRGRGRERDDAGVRPVGPRPVSPARLRREARDRAPRARRRIRLGSRDALDETGATFMQATPTTWRMLVDAGWEGKRSSRSSAAARRCRGASRTSSSTAARRSGTCTARPRRRSGRRRSSSARGHGRPRSADRSRTRASTSSTATCRPVPIGVAGELLIGGRRRGPWLSQPPRADGARGSSTNPFDALASGRVYRTGDRMRFRDRRDTRVPRPPRPPGEAARLPHRAGRDRGGTRRTPGHSPVGRRHRRGRDRRQAPRRLHRRRNGPRARPSTICAATSRESVPAYARAVDDRSARRAAA